MSEIHISFLVTTKSWLQETAVVPMGHTDDSFIPFQAVLISTPLQSSESGSAQNEQSEDVRQENTSAQGWDGLQDHQPPLHARSEEG